jgi:hypothetical protein
VKATLRWWGQRLCVRWATSSSPSSCRRWHLFTESWATSAHAASWWGCAGAADSPLPKQRTRPPMSLRWNRLTRTSRPRGYSWTPYLKPSPPPRWPRLGLGFLIMVAPSASREEAIAHRRGKMCMRPAVTAAWCGCWGLGVEAARPRAWGADTLIDGHWIR